MKLKSTSGKTKQTHWEVGDYRACDHGYDGPMALYQKEVTCRGCKKWLRNRRIE